MRVAVCPGTFDPVTLGHVDVIERAAKLFDLVLVTVSASSRKSAMFSVEERVAFLKDALTGTSNVKIDSFDRLLVDFCREHGAQAVIKGLRAVSDFEYEFEMAQMNRKLDPTVETIFIMASPEYAYLSSSAVKEIAAYGGDVSTLVPPNVQASLVVGFAGDTGR